MIPEVKGLVLVEILAAVPAFVVCHIQVNHLNMLDQVVLPFENLLAFVALELLLRVMSGFDVVLVFCPVGKILSAVRTLNGQLMIAKLELVQLFAPPQFDLAFRPESSRRFPTGNCNLLAF